MSEYIQLKEQDGVLEIKFSRPDKKNALSNDMYLAAALALENADKDDAIRVILFSGAEDCFTAGNDIADFVQLNENEHHAPRFIKALANTQKPIVAAVPGLAVGIGTTMLLHCDLVYVSETSKLLAPFVNLALVPEAASSLLMPLRLGYVKAFAMFALGESITGVEATAMGLANRVLPPEQVLDEARSAAMVLAQKPVESLRLTKQLMRSSATLLSRMDDENQAFNELLKSAEAKEAFSAFLDRRTPDFSKFLPQTDSAK